MRAVLSDRDAEIALLGFGLALNEAAFSRRAFARDVAKHDRKLRDDAAVNAPRNQKIADAYVKAVGGDPNRTPEVVTALAKHRALTKASIRRILKSKGVFLPSR